MPTNIDNVTCDIAFKEWSAVCRALADGRQSLLVRKGGILEGPAGFLPVHSEFWLLPTHFHETPGALAESDRRYFEPAAADAAQTVRIDLLASVERVYRLADEAQLAALEPWHVYGSDTVRQRFAYRQPGLYVLAVRIWRAAELWQSAAWPELAGCRTWVQLPTALSTSALAPVLSAAEHAARLAALSNTLLSNTLLSNTLPSTALLPDTPGEQPAV